MRDEVCRSKLHTTRTIQLSQTPQRAARQADLEVRAITVEVKPPHARTHLPSVTHNVVLVEEVGGSFAVLSGRFWSAQAPLRSPAG